MCKNLNSKGNKVFVYDPLIQNKIKNKNFIFSNTLNFKNKFDGIFLAVPHKEIMNNLSKLNKFLNNDSIIYDLKSVISKNFKFKRNVKIINF